MNVTPSVVKLVNNVGVGLRNYRNNCFFNATLQALFHIPSIINCLLKNEQSHENCVACSLRDTFVETRQWSRAIFPSNLYDLLKTRHKGLLNGDQQDAHNFLLEMLNSSDELQHNPPLASNFQSEIMSTVTCKKCGNMYSQSTKYFSIQIDVAGTTRIQDGLKMFFETEVVDKFCPKCKKNVTADKHFKIVRAPTILCLQIKRFSIGSKVDTCVKITNGLIISNWMQQNSNCNKKYKLMAAICHTGSLNFGHYKTIICENGNFYEYDDALVKLISFKNIENSSEAYILFYELQNCEDELLGDEENSNSVCNGYMAPESPEYEELRQKDEMGDFREVEFENSNGSIIGITTEIPNAISNDYMASLDSDEWIPVDINDVDEDADGLDFINNFSSLLNSSLSVSNNGTSIGQATKASEEASAAICHNYMANDSCEEDDCQEVDITDFDNDHDALEWLRNISNDRGSGSLTQDSVENESRFSGRRIVDFEYVFDQLQKCTDIVCKKCRNGTMSLSKESRWGLGSTFNLSCTSCADTKKVFSDQRKNMKQSKINEAAALGIVSIGLGFNHLEEFCTILDIPCMSYKTYHEKDQILQNYWWTLAKKMQDEALIEEIRLAKECNEVDSAGNALIAVKADGSWHTRSYGTNYTSLAGCAVIIGVRTNKILYMDVKSKYCHICTMARANCTPPNIHECNANYDGPSSGMENVIIVEGFKFCEKKGARFNKFIGDGDSNTYKTLRDLRLYKNPSVYIDKFDCLNHLDKNFGKKFIELCKSKKYDKTGANLLTRKIGENIRKGVRMAAKHWKEQDLNEYEKCTNLEKDCMNAPLHCFGVHDNCADYFCTKSTTPRAREYVCQLKSCGLYLAVLNLCQYYYANKVTSLLAGYENNIAEGFNSLVAKYTGGKRVFNALCRSYKGRTGQSSVQFNSGGRSTSTFQQFVYDNPKRACLKLEATRKRKNIENAIRNDRTPKKRKNDESRGSGKKRIPYGAGHEELDFTDSQLAIAKVNFLEQREEDRQNREAIQIQTKGQRCNTRWCEIRHNLLTSSYFGRILNARNRKSYSKIVEDILYHNEQYSNTAELVHQRGHGKDALTIFCDVFKDELVDLCGIFIDEEHCFLGASPFRLCGQEGLLMVQCPHKLYGKSIVDSINNNLIPFWKASAGNIQINIKSHWYIQIQGQLHICNKNFAYLIVYLSDTEFKIEKVQRDKDFWDQQMEKELIFFFEEAMVKELVNSRDRRGMELRKYDEVSKTFI